MTSNHGDEMKKHNPENERTKRAYFTFLKEAKGLSETSVDAAATAIARFEAYSRWRSFNAFHFEQATSFKRHLATQHGQRSGEPMSKATLRHTLAALKAFLNGFQDSRGFGSASPIRMRSYFNLSLKDATLARATREERIPTLEQIHRVLDSMPQQTAVNRRNRAMIALAALTAARADALASMRLRHIDIEAGCISQDARQVRTKNSKSFPTFFVQIGGNARSIVEDWVTYLRCNRLWGPDDPLFPATRWPSIRTVSFPRSASIAGGGEMRRQSERFSAMPSPRRRCPIAILTRFEKRLCSSVSRLAGRRRSIKRSRRTSVMRTC